MQPVNRFSVSILISFTLLYGGCKKFVAIGPPETQLVTQTVFDNDATALSAIRGIYIRMISGGGFASGSLSSVTDLAGLSADDLQDFSTSADMIGFAHNSLLPTNSQLTTSLWGEMYKNIYESNAVIEGLHSSGGVTATLKQQLTGEATFIRAYCYFYLVNLFGDVPLITSTDYLLNSKLPRTAAGDVYAQIKKDFLEAQQLLSADYSFSGNERIRPNKAAAEAMLARVDLYTADWPNAESFADSVINNTGMYTLVPDLNAVFLKNSMEAIWQLMPVLSAQNTNEGSLFILTTNPNNVALDSALLNAFDPADLRKSDWVKKIVTGTGTYYYPYKYKIKTGGSLSEYSMVIRLAELYLIRAEARTQQNDFEGARADINLIRDRAQLADITANDKDSLLLAIEQERRVELFTEWGHRWLDLKRTKRADAVLGPLKYPNWQSTDVLYPIPRSEISNDPSLTQNAGY
jgi:hypothetical protein